MKTVLTIMVLLILSHSTFAQESSEIKDCLQNAYTQKELNHCTTTNYKAVDAELNRVYQQIREEYKNDPIFLNKLKTAQLAWIKFRDASLQMTYPHTDDPAYYGTVLAMCLNSELAELTQTRIVQLKLWVKGLPEGDVCAGSVKRQE